MLCGRLGVNPTELVQRASSDNGGTKELSKQIKILFAQLTDRYSAGARNVALAALRSFLRLNEIDLPLIGLRIQRFPKIKPFLSWTDAEKIISKTHPEYRDCYTVMLWGGLDDQRFIELNTDEARIADIKKQLTNEAAQWIKVDIPKGRKQSPPYYVMIPRNVASLLPVLHRNGKPIASKQRLIIHWNTGLRRVGFNYKRFGPHTLRSVFRSEATRRGLNPVIAEFQLGHRPDPLNYQRLNQDMKWVLGEFEKAWQTQTLATEAEVQSVKKELAERDAKIERLEAQVNELGAFLTLVSQRAVQRKGGKKEPIYLSWDPDKLGKYLEKARAGNPRVRS